MNTKQLLEGVHSAVQHKQWRRVRVEDLRLVALHTEGGIKFIFPEPQGQQKCFELLHQIITKPTINWEAKRVLVEVHLAGGSSLRYMLSWHNEIAPRIRSTQTKRSWLARIFL